jgi:hypothetical protein
MDLPPLLAYTTGPTDLEAPLQPEGLGSFIAVGPTGADLLTRLFPARG